MLAALSRAIIAGALLAGSVKAGDHFIISQCRELSYTRLDPLRFAETLGPHVHNVVGASTFGADSTTPESLERAKCSSTMVQDDKSIYWTPLLYYNHGNGSYSPLISSTRIYYFLKPGNHTTPVVPFPRGFRMLGGGINEARPKVFPPRGELSYDQRQALDPRINAIMWGCSAGAVQGQGTGGSLPGQRPYLPNDAPNGCGVINAGMFFPSCGDGRLDSDDHFSHMAYPLDESNGFICPASHPIKYPTIFIEHFYFPSADQPYRGANQDNWILSNGDPTGLTMHGDFINGWNQDTLQQTLQQCNTPNAPEENLQNCAPLAKSLNVEAANTCLSEGNIPNEDVGLTAPITSFPGCNPYWPWDAPSKPTCKTPDNVALVPPSGRYTVPDYKLNLPIANGTASQSVTGPAGGNLTDYYGYSYTSSSYAYTASSSAASTPAALSASATQTASSSEATPTGGVKSEDPTLSAASTSYTASASYVASASDASAPSAVSSSSAVPTSSSSYDFGNPSDPTSTQSAGAPVLTASSQDPAQATSTADAQAQNPGAAAQVTSSVVSSASFTPSTPSSASYSSSTLASTEAPVQAPGAAAQVTSSIISSASYTPSTPSSASYSTSTLASTDAPAQTPGAAAQVTSSVISSAPYTPSTPSSASYSSSTSPANATPAAQNANTLHPGGPKTCRRKSNKSRARRHREKKRRTMH